MDLETYLQQDSSTSYYVEDITFNTGKEKGIVFILESPYIDEVKAQKPLMGDSGIEISRILLNSESPFGELSSNLDIKIALINVSNVPLQKIDEKEERTNYKDVNGMKDFETFRSDAPDRNSAFFKNFEKRIKKYINKKNILVVCGKFSSDYFFEVLYKNKGLMKQFFDNDIKVIKLPHPSYQSWKKIIKYHNALMNLKELFSTLKNPI